MTPGNPNQTKRNHNHQQQRLAYRTISESNNGKNHKKDDGHGRRSG